MSEQDNPTAQEILGNFNFQAARNAAAQAAPDLVQAWEKHTAEATKGGIKGMMTGRRDTFIVSLFDLHIEEGWNLRIMEDAENIAHIEWLAESIAENGIREPLEVIMRDNKLYIDDGHCRYFGAVLAITKYGTKLEGVRVTLVEKGADKVDRLLTQILRNTGKRPSNLEVGGNFKKLIRLGLTEKDIARRVSMSEAYVSGVLKLQEADPEAKLLITTGKVAQTEAFKVVREVGADRATEVLAEAVAEAEKEGKTKATAKHINRVMGRTSPAKRIESARKLIERARETEGGETISVNREVWDEMVRLLSKD